MCVCAAVCALPPLLIPHPFTPNKPNPKQKIKPQQQTQYPRYPTIENWATLAPTLHPLGVDLLAVRVQCACILTYINIICISYVKYVFVSLELVRIRALD